MNQIKLPRSFKHDLAALRELRAKELKGSPTLRKFRKLVEQEYRAYELRYRQPVPLNKLKRVDRTSARVLYELYDRGLDCFGYIKKLRDNANELLQSCPYCGLPDTLTLDHYLPRSTKLFPHLSVLTANLVPACMPCQNAKGHFYPGKSKTRRVRPARQNDPQRLLSGQPIRGAFNRRLAAKARLTGDLRILHPYFDEIFSTRMLRLVDVKGVKVLAASGSFYRKHRLVSFHVYKLRLADRTALTINRTLDHVVASLQAFDATTIDDARALAGNLLKSAYGANNQGGSIEILVRHKVADDPRLQADLLAKALASNYEMKMVSQVVDLSAGMI